MQKSKAKPKARAKPIKKRVSATAIRKKTYKPRVSGKSFLDTRDRQIKEGKIRYTFYAGYVTSEQAHRTARSLRQETKGTLAIVKKNPKRLEPWEVWIKHTKPF